MGTQRTVIERKFIKAYIENGGNATRAYIEARPDIDEDSAKVLGCRLLTKVNLSNNELMELMGITDGYLHEKLDEGLNATKTISVIPVKSKEAQDNSTDLPEANSKNIEFVDVNDFAVRHRYLDTAYKLKGKYPPTTVKNELTGAGGEPISFKFIIEKTYSEPNPENKDAQN